MEDYSDELRAILDATPFPLLISRMADGTVLYANDNVAAYLHVPSAELVGRKTPDFYANPKERNALVEELERVRSVGNYELRLRQPDGQERWMILSAVRARLRGEDVIVSGLTDITNRKETEEKLRHSEELFRSLVENANDIIYLLTTDGEFTYVSPNWTDVLGHDVLEIVGSHFGPLVHPDDLDTCYAFLTKVIETGERRSGVEYRVRHKDGSWRWHTSNASSLKDDEGNVVNFVGIARDITDKKQAQLELERAHRDLQEKEVQLIQAERMAALGRLVSGVAHEINSPIGAIRSMNNTMSSAVEKLRRCVAEASPELRKKHRLDTVAEVILEANRVIGEGAERITEIVDSLRSLTRLDEADLKVADIHKGIDSALTVMGHDLKDRVEVVKEYGDIGPIVCYPRRLNQVFLNMLSNASNAIDGMGRITIRTFGDTDEIRVAIEDTGCGIRPEERERIFEPHFTTKGNRIGTGIGLSICYNIINQHNGQIDVESEPGTGSVFTIVLPRDLKAEPPPESH